MSRIDRASRIETQKGDKDSFQSIHSGLAFLRGATITALRLLQGGYMWWTLDTHRRQISCREFPSIGFFMKLTVFGCKCNVWHLSHLYLIALTKITLSGMNQFIGSVSKSAVKNPYRSKHCLLLKRQISSQVQVFLWLSDKAAFVQLTKVKWIALSESCYNWGTDFALLIQIILDSGGKAGTHLRLIAPIFHLSPLSMKGHDTIWESRSRDKLCFITSLNKYHEMYTKW